jgi:arylsulfatase A-like enzyme
MQRTLGKAVAVLAWLSCAGALFVAACKGLLHSSSARPPNVILIVADDLGLGDLGCYGQAKIRTPALDALAAQGLRFTQAYAGAPVCAPSRCCLLTGMHTGHGAIRDNKEIQPEGQQPLPGATTTLAELLQARGYATAAIGKWGLGPPGSEGDPLRQGFEHFFGYNCQRAAQTHYPQRLYRDHDRFQLAGNEPGKTSSAIYAPDLMREEALAFVRQNAQRPFFLYFATTLPHAALQVPDEALREYTGVFPETPYDGKQGYIPHPTPRAAYAAMITRMDRDIGAILAELERLGLSKNTLVVFTSDNGPNPAGGVDAKFFGSTAGLRGTKGQLYEGGIRAPLIVRWPRSVKAGSTSGVPCASWDLLPTIAEACDLDVPADLDGRSLVPLLEGGPAPERDFLYWESPDTGGWQAVRMGNWKAVRRNLKKYIPGPLEIYDLATDPGETRDVAQQHPELVKRAREAFASRSESPIAEWNFPRPR